MNVFLVALTLTAAMPDNLGQIKVDVDAVRILHKDGVISDQQASAYEADLLGKASQIQGKTDYATLDAMTNGIVDQLLHLHSNTHHHRRLDRHRGDLRPRWSLPRRYPRKHPRGSIRGYRVRLVGWSNYFFLSVDAFNGVNVIAIA